ncbi:MAG: tRNA (guanine(37)-N(1))-methyltransferase, partial [Desulfovibrionaceae bacterium]|nr:tRNA (guanine(37)-N(1))-methyltransferase [Desulfovibrionaceae bacterium]
SGRPLTQSLARELSKDPRLTLICGRYEGIDARLQTLFPIETVSVGEAVLNGGEAAAMMLIEAACRLIPGFMGKEESGEDESFSNGLLEYPHYTRPELFEALAVPEILRGGDHGRIAAWRREQSLLTTLRRRPEMLDGAPLTHSDLSVLKEAVAEENAPRLGRNLHCALVHYPVFLDEKKCGATSLTNLDIHDIARCSRTYGLKSVQIVTPLADQQHLLDVLLQHWTQGPGSRSNPDRAEALSLVRKAGSLEEAIASVREQCGEAPLVVATSARYGLAELITCGSVRHALSERPVLLVFGTGHGLAPEALKLCDGALRPLRYLEGYNHLPVRGAAAIILDRLLGDCDWPSWRTE